MNKLLIFFAIIINTICFSQTENEIYPTNTDGRIVNKLDSLSKKNKLSEIEGNFYAFDAKIINLKKAYKEKPYFEVEFPDGQKIWIASLLKSEYLKIGSQLKILGIVSKVNKNDKIAKKLNDKNYHILMFAFLDVITFEAKAFEGALEQAEQWRNGNIPEKLE